MDGYTTVLNGAAYAGTGLWAVGGAYPTGNYSAEVTYAVYYGKRWQLIATPNVAGHVNVLSAVSASSATNVWAVGQTYSRDGQSSPLVEHWNGKWHIVPTPLIQHGGTELTSVYALSSTDVWAAGRYSIEPWEYYEPLFEHWNGKTWSIITGSAVKGGQISGLAGSASNDIIAAGYVGTLSVLLPLSEHWDGTQWSVVPTPQVSGDYFAAVAHVPHSTEYWAAGALYPEGLKTVTARYDCSADAIAERRGSRTR
jgi:hypothetical protein